MSTGSHGGRRGHANPNRAAVLHCPYCAGTRLFPDVETSTSWNCRECRRVFSVTFHGALGRDVTPAPAAVGVGR